MNEMTPNAFVPTDFACTVRLDLEALPVESPPAPGSRGVSAPPVRGPQTSLTAVQACSPPAMQATATVAEPAHERALTLFVRGFTAMEQRLLEGTVRLSQRRKPRLELVHENEAHRADLIMLDGSDGAAVAWGEAQHWLHAKTAIWVDSSVARPRHLMSRRPVQWSILPMLLARALEQASDARPQAPKSALLSNPTSNAVLAPADAPHVLVVDDSLAVRNHLRSLLEARGLRVSEANCVQAALETVTAKRFACVLMDVLMPDIDGYEGCKRIKSLRSSIGVVPVVMLTSKSSPFDRIRGKMAGCDAYLTKPVEPAQLYEVVAQHTGFGGRISEPTRARDSRLSSAGLPRQTMSV